MVVPLGTRCVPRLRNGQHETFARAEVGDGKKTATPQFAEEAGNGGSGGANCVGELGMGNPDVDQGALGMVAAEGFRQEPEEPKEALIEVGAGLHRGPGLHLAEAGGDASGEIQIPGGDGPTL